MNTKRAKVRKQSRNRKMVTRKVSKSGNTAAGVRRHAAGDTGPDRFGRPMESVITAARRLWLSTETAAASKPTPTRKARPRAYRKGLVQSRS